MTGDGFRVDYDQLDEMAGVLDSLKEQFEGLEDGIEPYREAAGHGGLSSALDRFASNWSDDRGEICETMQCVCEYGHAAAEGYRDADHSLGNQYSQA